MKPTLRLIIACALICWAATAPAQTGVVTKKPTAPAMPEMGASKQIKQLSDMTGEWKTMIKYKMDPSQPVWAESVGSAKYEYVLDSCGIIGHFSGEFGGMAMNGIMVIAFNRELGRYQTYWLESMMGNPSFWQGSKDSTGAIVYTGVDKYQGKDVYMRMTQRMPDKRSLIMSFEESYDGKTYKPSMEITHTKQ